MNREHFGELPLLSSNENVTSNLRRFYRQERDWTCSLACVRSLISSYEKDITEENIIKEQGLIPGPHYAKAIKNWKVLSKYNVKSSVDSPIDAHNPAEELYLLLKQGFNVMIETMINYDHWVVVTGIYPSEDKDIGKSQVTYYDPYFNKVRMIFLEELISMWVSGEHSANGIINDYIAIKEGD